MSTVGSLSTCRKKIDMPPGPRSDSKLTLPTMSITTFYSCPTMTELDDADAAKHTTPPTPLLKTLVSSISRALTTISPGTGIRPTSWVTSVRYRASTAAKEVCWLTFCAGYVVWLCGVLRQSSGWCRGGFGVANKSLFHLARSGYQVAPM
jgi:hypothetical protein